MINLFLGGFRKKKERGRIEREGGKNKKTCKSLPCDLQVFFPLNEPGALEPAYLSRERQNSFFDKVSC